MTSIAVFAALSIVVGLVSIYGRSAWWRAGAFAALVLGVLLLWYTSMGLPRPQYLRIPSGEVLGFRLEEPTAIYLWLVPNGGSQPLALQLPWSDEVASNLVDTARRRANPDDTLRMESEQQGTMGLRSRPMFYLSHATALPPKTTPR